MNPMGYQWCPIPWIDGSSEAEADAAMELSIADLNGFLDMVMAEEGLGPEALAIVGFSQGTMMALHLAPQAGGAFGRSRLFLRPALAARTPGR